VTTRLFVDGEPVDPGWLRRAVRQVVPDLVRAGAGPTRAVGAGAHPLATVVSALAAAAIDAPLLLAGRLSGGGAVPVATVTMVGRQPAVRVTPWVPPDQPALPPGTAAVFSTSGSSGDPKQVALSESGLSYQAAATRARLDVDDRDGLCVPLPLRHAYGFSILRIWQLAGARLYLETAFRPDRIAGLLAAGGVTSFDGVPSMYASLLRAGPDTVPLLARLRIRGCGGDVLPPELRDSFLARIGVPIHDGYGLTEAGPNVAISGPDHWRAGTVGPPLDGTDVRVSDGELMVRGPAVMIGYVGDPAATAQAVDPDGWLHTGDVATIGSDGYVTVHGRAKEVLVVHGETVAPAVLEALLDGCPGVVETGVVAHRSGTVRGDRIIAFVVGDRGCPAAQTVATLRRECRTRLPARLRPADIRVVDALPRLSSGKLDRQTLRHLSGDAGWTS
jgi:acyl-CoA synthetase (AMP-forming)/AMP-acid ligase II